MEIVILLGGLVLIGVAVTLIARVIANPGPSTEAIEQISSYGFSAPVHVDEGRAGEGSLRNAFDGLAGWIGSSLGSRLSPIRERELRDKLVAAGMYTVTPRRVYGYQFVLAAGSALIWVWLSGLSGEGPVLVFVGALACIAAGWVAPVFYVERTRRVRLNRIDKELPDLIDLLVVTIEAGLSFNQGLRLAGDRVHGPLSQEVRLTLQEQNMGLTLTEAMRHLLERAETPGVRSFVRAITQGEMLGVSTGQIMRNLAEEMRKRRKAAAEERAQKAPVKMLFPILFLIFPAIFIVLLLPALLRIGDVLG